jgi:hypothetical protein
MSDALRHSIGANSYGTGVTDGDRDDGGREDHRRASGRLNWSSRKSIEVMGELHRSTVKLQEVMVWLENGWGELSTVSRTAAEWSGGCRGERKPKK